MLDFGSKVLPDGSRVQQQLTKNKLCLQRTQEMFTMDVMEDNEVVHSVQQCTHCSSPSVTL